MAISNLVSPCFSQNLSHLFLMPTTTSTTNLACYNGTTVTIFATTFSVQLTLPEKAATLSSMNDSGWHRQVKWLWVVSADKYISPTIPKPILKTNGSTSCDCNFPGQNISSGPNANSQGQCPIPALSNTTKVTVGPQQVARGKQASGQVMYRAEVTSASALVWTDVLERPSQPKLSLPSCFPCQTLFNFQEVPEIRNAVQVPGQSCVVLLLKHLFVFVHKTLSSLCPPQVVTRGGGLSWDVKYQKTVY